MTAWLPLPGSVDLKRCPECGAAALEGETECSQCGARPDDDVTWRGRAGSWTCLVCGAVNGAAVEVCEGQLLDPEDGGDERHPPVYGDAEREVTE